MGGKYSSLIYHLSVSNRLSSNVTNCVVFLSPRFCFFSQLFRLEHEHLYNSFNYRKVSFVPLHFSTEIKEKEDFKPKQGLRILTEVLGMALLVVFATILSIFLARVSKDQGQLGP